MYPYTEQNNPSLDIYSGSHLLVAGVPGNKALADMIMATLPLITEWMESLLRTVYVRWAMYCKVIIDVPNNEAAYIKQFKTSFCWGWSEIDEIKLLELELEYNIIPYKGVKIHPYKGVKNTLIVIRFKTSVCRFSLSERIFFLYLNKLRKPFKL